MTTHIAFPQNPIILANEKHTSQWKNSLLVEYHQVAVAAVGVVRVFAVLITLFSLFC